MLVCFWSLQYFEMMVLFNPLVGVKINIVGTLNWKLFSKQLKAERHKHWEKGKMGL